MNKNISRTRQYKKNEALNAIRKIYNPKYDFNYSQTDPYGDWNDIPKRNT